MLVNALLVGVIVYLLIRCVQHEWEAEDQRGREFRRNVKRSQAEAQRLEDER